MRTDHRGVTRRNRLNDETFDESKIHNSISHVSPASYERRSATIAPVSRKNLQKDGASPSVFHLSIIALRPLISRAELGGGRERGAAAVTVNEFGARRKARRKQD